MKWEWIYKLKNFLRVFLKYVIFLTTFGMAKFAVACFRFPSNALKHWSAFSSRFLRFQNLKKKK